MNPSREFMEKTHARMREQVESLRLTQEQAQKIWGRGTYVNMCAHEVVGVHDRIYTRGLGGCTAILAQSGDKIMMAHYAPSFFEDLLHDAIHFQAEKVIIAVTYGEEYGFWTRMIVPWFAGAQVTILRYSGLMSDDGAGATFIYDDGQITLEGKSVAWNTPSVVDPRSLGREPVDRIGRFRD